MKIIFPSEIRNHRNRIQPAKGGWTENKRG